MKFRTAKKIQRSDNEYWQRIVDDYQIRGIKNKAYLAARRMIRCLNNAIKKAKNNEHKYETINKENICKYINV